MSKTEVTKPSGGTIELTFADMKPDEYDELYGYTFDELGEPTIYYTVTEPTLTGQSLADNFLTLLSMSIPNSATSVAVLSLVVHSSQP